MTFRNERIFYKRPCDLCKKDIVSAYPGGTKFPVYCHECWYSDKWDPQDYAVECDFSMPFLQQFGKLIESVPRPALIGSNNKESPYVNYSANLKNCYLTNCSDACEDCGYCDRTFRTKKSFDCFGVIDSEQCIENNQCTKNYQAAFAENCENIIESALVKNCKNSSSCLGCINQRNQTYSYLNKPISKEIFKKRRGDLGSYKEFCRFQKEFFNLKNQSPHRFAQIILSQNSDGNELREAKNCHASFFVINGENLKHANFCSNIKDSMDFNFADNAELIYECSNVEQNANELFSITCWFSHNITYSDLCLSSSYIFASIGLRNKQYCILNKQYTKEEYEALISKIIWHMNSMPYIDKLGRIYKYGEFFPTEISPFAYNETVAQSFFPFTQEQAEKQGYRWKKSEERNYAISIKSEDLIDHVKDADDSIIGKVIECAHKGKCNEQCTTAFKIIPQEFQLYKKMNLPLPRLCPNCRYHQRLQQRTPLRLWHRQCMCGKPNHGHTGHCQNEFETSYSPDRPEIVYCEQCYQQEVA